MAAGTKAGAGTCPFPKLAETAGIASCADALSAKNLIEGLIVCEVVNGYRCLGVVAPWASVRWAPYTFGAGGRACRFGWDGSGVDRSSGRQGGGARVPVLGPEVVARLVDSWERTQDRYATDRAARSAVVAELLDEVIGRCDLRGQEGAPPVVVELGCGPGTLADQLAERFPNVDVIGVDADGVLLALGRSVAGARVRLIEAQVGRDGWEHALGEIGPVLAVVASAVLHYPSPEELQVIYRQVHTLLAPGGLLVNADQFLDSQPRVADLQRRVAQVATDVGASLDWDDWWAELRRVLGPEGSDEVLPVGPELGGENGLSVADHEAMLRSVGFGEVGVVWRCGAGAVLVAVR